MSTEAEIVAFMATLRQVVVQRAKAGDGTPEIAWGDTFCYVSPDGTVPASQPFATVVTKDYPGDSASRLDRDGAFRVNVAAGRDTFVALVGRGPRDPAGPDEPAPDTVDTVIAHPVYGTLGWLAVVNPGPATDGVLQDLLRRAYDLAVARHERRAGTD